MLTEQDLNRIKGLVHFLNSEGKPATRETGGGGHTRSPAPAVAANLPKSSVRFVVDVFDRDLNHVGFIKAENPESSQLTYGVFIG